MPRIDGKYRAGRAGATNETSAGGSSVTSGRDYPAEPALDLSTDPVGVRSRHPSPSGARGPGTYPEPVS